MNFNIKVRITALVWRIAASVAMGKRLKDVKVTRKRPARVVSLAFVQSFDSSGSLNDIESLFLESILTVFPAKNRKRTYKEDHVQNVSYFHVFFFR